eukprot:CAMPEP_0204357292 /NCGR_PEP_ID=MMETSP0469-20131031/35631_1 /ASSEMBLY_ACC=CAM_ASM_000384 /TAXON_ID=2969 /ORGANISM="Oxyrrhis marina" /LENGTH=31 /DNA_ID= /DNA_START= /DNA_END= /DNA_ORIENTATION=
MSGYTAVLNLASSSLAAGDSGSWDASLDPMA